MRDSLEEGEVIVREVEGAPGRGGAGGGGWVQPGLERV